MDLNLPNKPFLEAVCIISFNVNSERLAYIVIISFKLIWVCFFKDGKSFLAYFVRLPGSISCAES